MEPFRILMVDDDPIMVRTWTELLDHDKDELTGTAGRAVAIDVARNQVEAQAAIDEKPRKGYDLVLLDLRYPLDSDPATEDYRGQTWIPQLRHQQPNAAIAIITSYAYENGLKRAVETLQSGQTDEFIPKDVKWVEILQRLKAALAHRHRMRQLAAAAGPVLSNVSRTASEDVHVALHRAQTEIQRTCTDATALQILNNLQVEIERITSRLHGRIQSGPSSVPCCDFTDEEALIFEQQAKSPIRVTCEGSCTVMTYKDDLRVAVREIFQNAVDAVLEVGVDGPDVISASVRRDAEINSVIITIRDRGKGLSPEAIATLYEPGKSHWKKDSGRHKGMGLYVARRMMFSIGGDLEVRSADGGGSEALLTVKDWAAE